jgi:curli biogenesis system outer membrane secretion channel CsgG
MRIGSRWLAYLGCMALALAVIPGRALADPDDPVVDHSRTSDRLEALPRLPMNQRKVVTIYQFTSGVPGVSNSALTDMFTTALIKSGAFLVAERERLNADIATEKGLNAHGMSTGDTAQHKIAAAQFIFEGTVSESNADQDDSSTTGSIGGLNVGGSHQNGKIAIDVRVVDADSGLVMDSIDVSKMLRSHGSSFSGLGAFANSVAGLGGGSIPLAPDVSHTENHNAGVDEALRACIEAAVLELVHRYSSAS